MPVDYADFIDTPEFCVTFKQIIGFLKVNGLVEDADKFEYYAERTFGNTNEPTVAQITDSSEEPHNPTVSFEELYGKQR